MSYRDALITAVVTILLTLASGFGIAWYREKPTLLCWVESTWMISIAFAMVGWLCRKGAVTGDTVTRTEAVLNTSHNKGGVLDAENDDVRSGLAFGWVVMLSALFVFGVSLTILKLSWSG